MIWPVVRTIYLSQAKFAAFHSIFAAVLTSFHWKIEKWYPFCSIVELVLQLYQICRFWDSNGTSQIGKITFFGDVSTEHLELKTDIAKTDLFFCCLFYRESVIEEVYLFIKWWWWFVDKIMRLVVLLWIILFWKKG